MKLKILVTVLAVPRAVSKTVILWYKSIIMHTQNTTSEIETGIAKNAAKDLFRASYAAKTCSLCTMGRDTPERDITRNVYSKRHCRLFQRAKGGKIRPLYVRGIHTLTP